MRPLSFLAVTLTCLVAQAAGLTELRDRLSSGSEPVTVVCLGDSVTGVYYHTGGRRAYPEMVELALKRQFPQSQVKVINAGISGNATVNGLERLDRDVLRHHPQVVTVMFGLNDMVRVPLADFRANLVTIVGRCREAGAVAILCTPNSIIDNSGRPVAKLITYCDVIREVARELETPLADVYASLDRRQRQDPHAWRLLFSDEIHPNMDGHKRMAEVLASTIAGTEVAPLDVPAPRPALLRTRQLLAEKKPVRILAMPPADQLVPAALRALDPDARVELTRWESADKSLETLEKEAQATVRQQRPDLVVIVVPGSADAQSEEARIRAITWIMNWSLSFGNQEWDCLVIHRRVGEPEGGSAVHDDLVRHLVRAQHLTLLDRETTNSTPPADLVNRWFVEEFSLPATN